ncbi:MAG: hypothetical protein HC889_16945 [Synechococcaceae cyanobacterium SM1_2_3]|nr:hypothetical protein [Synechococcaceae cyanobacterium SM1_2_3]
MTDLASELHGIARLQVALARMDGHKIDKPLMRFNDLVQCALAYGSPFNCRVAMRTEAIGQCVIGDMDYIGAISDYRWTIEGVVKDGNN